MIKPLKNQYGQLRFTGFFVLVFLISGVLLVANWQQQRIEVVFKNQSCLLEGTAFELQWIHSVEKQQWVEAYQVQDKNLLLTDTYFETFGAGSPSMSASDLIDDSIQHQSQLLNQKQAAAYQARQNHLNQKYQHYVHYQVNQQLPYLNWMVSSHVKAIIINQNQTLPIYQWVSDYTNIYIAPKKLTVWAQLLQESCHDYTAHSSARIRG
ncbi:DUF1850 domain-containing protein [Psychrobacter sp. FDAARGOS_221]|uniref:DUF1850 domain-containing protein n=1 Tax=Psychrobacter sp. FDAARGOS_221 TaxID=1975705 RepID=UPI000BB594D6|nr:DUF1850 domain-containing protein [Psychrobacter sp. FDAARGOS_221]PNK61661.1 DUF1850 domain-containing protein [Psychrobacter sp. FDAARGOS_221]